MGDFEIREPTGFLCVAYIILIMNQAYINKHFSSLSSIVVSLPKPLLFSFHLLVDCANRMAISRSARISILLAIDVCFFFLELIVGQNNHTLSLKRAVELNNNNLLRIFCWFARAHCRQLSHAQVRLMTYHSTLCCLTQHCASEQ